MKKHILVIEDERDIRELVEYNLARDGYDVAGVDSGERAMESIRLRKPDLIILDLMLPGVDGYDVARRIKQNPGTAGIPIVMLTAKSQESDVVAGLELGAEDYVTKPFSPRVLLARIRAVFRRQTLPEPESQQVLRIHNLEIDPARFEVLVDEEPVDLSRTEFFLLHFLANHPGRVFDRSRIIDAVKGSDYPVTDRSVDVQIVGLRKKLKDSGKYIETVRGIGYRFKE